ncbi:MAG TPA: sugar ABC transporter ATP-binding protein [Aggregatilineales bacterium]|nr:sugar ABC transporter ATP-binding protein [Chloroflexota bacterium]HOA24428.1 sugar ABC transporter ATP-binding protein [Aggregatilineales bacterium]HPV06230.1 sugar ABC transporter ATP-binding protein [Aggregatilineales bacterium]HQA66872.1 sugar ABC transporter ATP-binding protein [Aggregatilineales bacterium]HQE17475.1 sugar ABC transporter ATP-binding protein [Aggregatilineales bacterium]
MSEDVFLEVNHLSKSFAGVKAVQDVSFTIRRGEIRCLIGENGSGKSTLIKMISGVYKPDQGEIIINGRRYTELLPIEAIREGIQVIYQDFSLFPNLTVAENLALNHELAQNRHFVNWREVREIARRALDHIHVDIDLDAIVGELSVADRQLIAISRALLHNARLIIMDEPTTALTQREVESLFSIVRKLQATGISILFVSHKLNEVREIADSVMVFRNGRKVADGGIEEFSLAKMTYYMTGREIKDTPYDFECDEKETPLLRVKDLTLPGCFYDVSFELRRGEILGITGLLGSGRSELAQALFGVQPAQSGQIWIDGEPVKIRSIQDAVRHNIGYVPEDRLTQGLFLERSIARNTIVRVLDRLTNKLGLLDSSRMSGLAKNWVDRLNIKTPSPELAAKNLSGGNQQRVVLAKWLASEPRVLILNGPTVGVDVGSKSELHQIIKNLAREGMGIIVISDEIPELLNTCNRILLMRDGRIAEAFKTKDITEETLSLKLAEAISAGLNGASARPQPA